MMKKGLIVSILIISCVKVLSQQIWKSGYLLLNDGDTIHGEIQVLKKNFAKVCNFKNLGDNKIQQYKPDDLAGFRFNSGSYYITKVLDTDSIKTKYFFEYLIKARVNIYYLNDGTDRFFIDKEYKGLTEIFYKEEILYPYYNTSYYMLDETKIEKSRDQIKNFMSDCPSIQNDISHLLPDKQSLIELAQTYHNKTCKDEKCVIYHKEMYFIYVFFNLFYNRFNLVGISQQNTLGFSFHVSVAKNKSEKIFFKTGLIVAKDINIKRPRYNTFHEFDFYRVPLQIEYIHPKGTIRPIVGAGIDLVIPKTFINLSFNLGINIKISEKIFLNTLFDYGFKPGSKLYLEKEMEKDIKYYSGYLGLCYKF